MSMVPVAIGAGQLDVDEFDVALESADLRVPANGDAYQAQLVVDERALGEMDGARRQNLEMQRRWRDAFEVRRIGEEREYFAPRAGNELASLEAIATGHAVPSVTSCGSEPPLLLERYSSKPDMHDRGEHGSHQQDEQGSPDELREVAAADHSCSSQSRARLKASFQRLRRRAAWSALICGSKVRSTCQERESSERSFQKPVARPARYAAPSAVVSITFGRTTGTCRMSAWNCISMSFADAPPSTRRVFIATPLSCFMTSSTSAT